MNFRSCRYFLTVCEMGTINAAARKLFISQQSLSQHIRRMEEEVGTKLFYRENPLILTEAGRCVQKAARTVLDALEEMEREIAACKGTAPRHLTIGLLDYGTPDFLSTIIDLFIEKEPDVMLHTQELKSGDRLPEDIPLFISPGELGSEYRSEVIITDQLCVCVSDELLKKVYGFQWQERRERLKKGDLSALEDCPFIQHRNSPLQPLQDMAFRVNGFKPNYLRVAGSINVFSQMCTNGKCAMVTLLRRASKEQGGPACYPIANVPERIPAAFICYRSDTTLSGPAQELLEITRRYFAQHEWH